MTCPTCNLPQADHTEDMAARCAVFDLSSNVVGRGVSESASAQILPDTAAPSSRSPLSADAAALSEAESAPGRESDPPVAPRPGASISIASVLLGWCNDIKRELEEFANDGPVGPMVPYRLEPNVAEGDLLMLRNRLFDLISLLGFLAEDVTDAMDRASGRVL